MDPLHMRPRFVEEHALPPEEALRRIDHALAAPDAPLVGSVAAPYVNLVLPPAERHFWSPWLAMSVRPTPSGGCVCRGRFGPHPSIWTGLIAAYAALGFAAVLGLMVGISQQIVQEPPWGYWGPAVGALGSLGVFATGWVGQRLGGEQMAQVRAFVHRALDEEVDPEGARVSSGLAHRGEFALRRG